MRKSGADFSDMSILIVSATEGIQRQTEECIDLIKNANQPFVVAINKIDKVESQNQVKAVEEGLVERGIELEPYGGDVPVIHISALRQHNTDLLLQLLLEETKHKKCKIDVPTNLLVLKSNFNVVRESEVVVKEGVLKRGQVFVGGDTVGTVKQIYDSFGNKIKQAKPGWIVKVLGLQTLPTNEVLYEVDCEKDGKKILSYV